MATDALLSIIASASAEARPRLACDDDDHFWVSDGGRCCPMGAEGCSQSVYVCKVCGVYDYGRGANSPGQIDCKAACGDSMMGWRGGPLDPDGAA
jgi:hypothetical protein